MNNPSNKGLLKVILSIGLIILLTTAISISAFGTDEDGIRILIRWSAKISAIFFALAFVASSIQYFFPGEISKHMLRWRPFFGVAFVLFHTAHLLFLIYLQNYIHPVFTLAKTSSLIAGGIAYGFMYLMFLTTFPSVKSKMKAKSWKILHLIGAYWIWAIFFNSYLKNVLNKDQYYFHFVLFLIVIVFRILSYLHKLKISRD